MAVADYNTATATILFRRVAVIMKKTVFSFVAFLLCFSLCSCMDKISESTQSETSSTTAIGIIMESTEQSEYQSFPSYDEIKAQYSDKTVLVWVIEETGYERNYPFRTNEINEYLDENGYDFAVCFYPIKAMKTDEKNDFYTKYVEEMAVNGENVDIIYSSFTYIEEAGNNAYHKYVYNGLFEPLDEYFNTDVGQTLYNIMPDKHWEALRVNGNIYGVDGAMHTLSDDYGYFVNKELADKYGYDISLSIYEQLDILKAVKENENCDVFAMYPNYYESSFFADIQTITSAVYFDDETRSAKCVLDNECYIDKLRLFHTLNKDEMLVDRGRNMTNSFFIMQSNQSGGSTVYNSAEVVDVAYNGNTITAYPVFTENTSVRASYMATGICSYSKNKEKAFELLALTQIDPKLNNLLTYGLEGVDYTVNNGCVDNIINPISIDRFANKMLCYPSEKVKLTSQQYDDIYESAGITDDIDFAFDGRGFVDESCATSKMMISFSFIGDNDFDESINSLYSALKTVGLDKLIEECNRQYKEYIKQ